MKLFVFLLFVSIDLSKALLLPLNSSILQLPSQDIIIATGDINTNKSLKDTPWPSPPFQRHIMDGLIIRITAYGDLLSSYYNQLILRALPSIQRIIFDAGEPSDVLEETTTVGVFSGDFYTEIGIYSLHPPAGINRVQAANVIHAIWQLVTEYSPPREITSSTIIAEGKQLALFRLSFRR